MSDTDALPPPLTPTIVSQVKRTQNWTLITIGLLAIVAIGARQQLMVLLYKTLQITLAVVVSYHADRLLFRFAPGIELDMLKDNVSAARLLARALVAVAVVLG